MKKTNTLATHENAFAEIEPFYPAGYDDIAADGYYGAATEDDEKQLVRAFLATLRRHWFLILFLNVVFVAAAIVYVAQKPDYYKAEARVQVNAETNPAAGAGPSQFYFSQLYDPAYFTTQLQIIEGAGLLRRVAKTLDLENNEAFLDPNGGNRTTAWENVEKMFQGRRASAQTAPAEPKIVTKKELSLRSAPAANPDVEAEEMAPYVALLKRGLSVAPVKDSRTSNKETRLIEIEFTHGDPVVAAKVANTIADLYVLQNLEQKIQTNASAGDFLQKRVADLQAEIRAGEERLVNYARSNQIVSLDNAQNTVVQRLADLNMKLGLAENERIAAQTAYQSAMQNKMREAAAESKDPQVVALESKLGELRQKLAQLKTEYTDEWFEVGQTKKQIESAEGQLAAIRKRATDIETAGLQQKLSEASAREGELRQNFERQRADVLRQNEASINYKIIQQEIDTNKSLLDGLLQKSKENDVILNGTPNNVLVVDHALVPRAAVGPERTKDVLIAFVASLVLGVGLAFAMDWFNDSVSHTENLEQLLGLPVLAAIPAAPVGLGKKLLPAAVQKRRKRVKSYNLKAFKRPEFAESFLQLRTYLKLSSPGGAPRTVLVTSGEEGEGKTVTALNLAKSLAETGARVLLIDADLRCPRLHSLTQTVNGAGLTTLLTAPAVDDALLAKVVQKDAEGRLDVLTSGERTPNPANLLSSTEMTALLERLGGTYAHIVIDSPPVIYFADSVIIASIVDAVLLVVRENASSKQTVLKAKKMMQNVGAKIVGVIVNGIPARSNGYYRYAAAAEAADEPLPAEGGDYLKLN